MHETTALSGRILGYHWVYHC